MIWKKLGNIYNPKMYDHDIKLSSHGANPLPIKLSDNIFRIYFNPVFYLHGKYKTVII